jgi:uncharacterized protein
VGALRHVLLGYLDWGRAFDCLPGAQVPSEIVHENGWACLKLHGPFPFSETGILASFVRPLSERAIPIFAVSTFDTDYMLVKQECVEKAVQALREAGHEEVQGQNP